jgi:hypothetical protein
MAEKKLEKKIEGNVVTITEAVTGEVMVFDFGDFPEVIQGKLGPFGLGHKLGDAAAGKSGQEAVDAIKKVAGGLMNSDWSVRAPAGERVSKASIKEKISGLSEEEQDIVKAALAKAGIKLD